MRGEYGKNVLKKPSLRYFGHLPKTDDLGMKLVFDGKHTISALKELQVVWLDDEEREKHEWSSSLQHALDVGVDVQLLQFKEDDEDAYIAYNVAAHHEDANKVRPSSLRDLVSVVERYKKRTPGGDYGQVQKQLEAIYGTKRRMMVYRMIVAAQTLSQDVLYLAHNCNIPGYYLNENKYYVGHGADAPKRLSSLTRVTTLQLLADSLVIRGAQMHL